MEEEQGFSEALLNIKNKPLQRGDILVSAVFTMEMTSAKFRTSTHMLSVEWRDVREENTFIVE